MSITRGALTATNASVAYSATSTTLFAANGNVMYRSVVNNTDKKLYIFFSSSAASTTTANTRILAAGDTYQFATPVYNGAVTAIGEAAGTGSWNTTEYVA